MFMQSVHIHANARLLGSHQGDSVKPHGHRNIVIEGTNHYLRNQSSTGGTVASYITKSEDTNGAGMWSIGKSGDGIGTETRGENVALAPRIIAY